MLERAGLVWNKLEGFPGRVASFTEERLSIERPKKLQVGA